MITNEKIPTAIINENVPFKNALITTEVLSTPKNREEFLTLTNKINQQEQKPLRNTSRLLKFICGCGCIIRTAKNKNKPLNAVCLYCNTTFKEVVEVLK